MIESLAVLSILGAGALEDYKGKRVSLILVMCGIMLGILNIIFGKNINTINMLCGAMVGVFLVLLSFITRGAVGVGDGLIFIATGLFLGLEMNAFLWLVSQFIAAFFSLFFMVTGLKRKNDTIPFIPFVLVAFVLILWGCRI